MRWVTYRTRPDGSDQVGLVVGGNVHRVETSLSSLVDLMAGGMDRRLALGRAATERPSEVIPLSAVPLRPPVPRPASFREFSAFEGHLKTMRAARGASVPEEWYQAPVFYFANHGAMYGDGEDIPWPGGSDEVDYEIEVACVIGREGRDIPESIAGEWIAGYTILNDWSARDRQRLDAKLGMGFSKCKDFANSLGPWLVTPDELEPYRAGRGFDLAMTASVNGQVYSRGNLADLYWSFPRMIAHASRDVTLYPGDLLATGCCPTGCIAELSLTHGSARFPWLQPGDVVELTVEQLGTLRNVVGQTRAS